MTKYILIAGGILVSLFALFQYSSALSVFVTAQGGSGTSSPSGILYGDNGATSHLNTVTIGSGLTFSGGSLSASGSSGNVSTSTHESAGELAYWTSNSATPALLGEEATSTLTPASPLTGSFIQIGSGGSLGCQTASGSQAGCLSSTDWTTFNNKGSGTVTSVATNASLSGGTITTSGTLSINLGNSNWWTARQNFTNASSSQLEATSSLRLTYLSGAAAGNFLAVDNLGYVIATSSPSGSNSAFSPAANYASTTTLPAYTYVAGVLTAVGNGALYIDGNNPSVGQRVLIKNENGACTSSSGACNNGLYDVTTAGSAIAAFVLTRDPQYNSSSSVIPGIVTYIISGTVNNDDFWALTSPAPITIGTTALNYTEVSGGGAAVTSVSNSDGTLTISPTTGNVVASLALAHANSWTQLQQFSNATSTLFSAYSAYFGATATSSFGNAGTLGITTPAQSNVGIDVSGSYSNAVDGNTSAANSISVAGSNTGTSGTEDGVSGLASGSTSGTNIGVSGDARSATTNNWAFFDAQGNNSFTAGTTFMAQASTTMFSNSGNTYLTALTSGDCVQASTGGLLISAAAACGTGTVTSVTASAPLFSSGGTTPNITWAGLATTTNIVSGQVLFATSASGVGGNTAFTFSNTGNTKLIVTNASTTNLTTNSGPVNANNALPLYMASSTWGTGTTTITILNNISNTTWEDARCNTSAGTLEMRLYSGKSSGTSNDILYWSASTTIGTLTFASNNVLSVATTTSIDIGNAASSPTNFNCTFEYQYNGS